MRVKRGRLSVFALSILLVFSFVFSMSSVTASAASDDETKIPASTEKSNRFAKTFKYIVKGKAPYGYDWTYKINTKNVKVSCKYDFKTKNYTFRVKGKKYGLTKVKLKYMKSKNKWVTVPMKIFVDTKKNVMRVKL